MNTIPITEQAVQLQVCELIRTKFPGTIFWSDGSGNNVSHVQAAINAALRSSKGIPDLFVAAPRGRYHGCFLELKAPDAPLYLKDGKLSTIEHIQQQAEVLQALSNAGYYANFAQGFEDAERQVTWYMNL